MPADAPTTPLPAWIMGHRGARAVVPENSFEGFTWAINQGVPAVELDVRLTRDGVLVCVHDETLAAYGGPADPISRMDAEEVARVRLSTGVGVPTLDAVLDLAEGRLDLNIELKNHTAEASFDPSRGAATALAELLAARVEAGRDDGIVAVSSFDGGSVTSFAQHSAGFARVAALLTPPGRDASRIIADAADLGVTAVHPHHTSFLAPSAGPRLLDAGLTVRTWTVNNRLLAQRLLRIGVHAIVTDDPLRLATVRR